MIEHDQLIRELPHIQQMCAEERLYNAKKRRIQQLDSWRLHEKTIENAKDSSNGIFMVSNTKRNELKYSNEILLLDATQRNDVDEVKQLLDSGIRPDIKNHDGFTALHQSSIDGNNEMLKLLIMYGADVNCVDDDGWTPLHAAAACKRSTIVHTLLDNGADMLALNAELTFPSDMTEDYEIIQIFEGELAKRGINESTMHELRGVPEIQYLQFLRNGGIDESTVILQRIDSTKATHLHFAAAYNFCTAAKYLIRLGIAIDVFDNKLWTPLHVACYFSQRSIVQILLENHANPSLMTDTGQTAFDDNALAQTPTYLTVPSSSSCSRFVVSCKDLCTDEEFRIWLMNFVTIVQQCDPLQRRSTLPAQYNISSNESTLKRNSIRRASLRESKQIKRHDDNYEMVLAVKDCISDEQVEAITNEFKGYSRLPEDTSGGNLKDPLHSDSTTEQTHVVVVSILNRETDDVKDAILTNKRKIQADLQHPGTHVNNTKRDKEPAKRQWFNCCTLL